MGKSRVSLISICKVLGIFILVGTLYMLAFGPKNKISNLMANYSTEAGNTFTSVMMYNASLEMYKRRAHVRKMCYGNLTHSHNFGKERSLASFDGKTILYCPIPKAGWSTWKGLFYREAGIGNLTQDPRYTGWASLWKRAGLKIVQTDFGAEVTHRVVFVRNPYDRLVSAYKDKVLRDNGAYVRRYFRHIHFNKPPEPALTFSQFITIITDMAKQQNTDLSTFGTGSQLDYHWKPQTLLCNFCALDYNIIGHLEHADEDAEHSLNILHMNSTVPKENSSPNSKPLSYWYSQLNSTLLIDIQRLYIYDFNILGYDSTPPI